MLLMHSTGLLSLIQTGLSRGGLAQHGLCDSCHRIQLVQGAYGLGEVCYGHLVKFLKGAGNEVSGVDDLEQLLCLAAPAESSRRDSVSLSAGELHSPAPSSFLYPQTQMAGTNSPGGRSSR